MLKIVSKYYEIYYMKIRWDQVGSEHGTPEKRRERLRQQEWKDNPQGVSKDSWERGRHGSLVDLVGALSWKGTGILLLVMILGFIVYAVFFR